MPTKPLGKTKLQFQVHSLAGDDDEDLCLKLEELNSNGWEVVQILSWASYSKATASILMSRKRK